MSVLEIKAALDADAENVYERAIMDMLESLGFARLPRRDAVTWQTQRRGGRSGKAGRRDDSCVCTLVVSR